MAAELLFPLEKHESAASTGKPMVGLLGPISDHLTTEKTCGRAVSPGRGICCGRETLKTRDSHSISCVHRKMAQIIVTR